MTKQDRGSIGCLAFVLHAHLPYVLHHGTWPHGLEWLLEAAAETYLPLLRTARRLREEGIPLCLNISISPVLLEQLAHPDFKTELPRYLQRKITSAREDAAFFAQAGETHLLSLAQHWEACFADTLAHLEALDGDLLTGFREMATNGDVDWMTSAATHGYLPLLGTDESVHGQMSTAVTAHRKHLGAAPTGAWLPECGYRPAGLWSFPVRPEGVPAISAGQRLGTETALADAGLRYTFVDTHLIEDAEPLTATAVAMLPAAKRTLYRPYSIAESGVAVFARDPRTAFQVWSAQFGYPGDFQYLDFHKKRWPGGHRYWRVTGAGLGMEAKEPYFPQNAAERSRTHAEHFVALVAETLRNERSPDGKPLLLCAPFDLELFGHWWHEGMLFLENVARVLARNEHGVQLASCTQYLQKHGTAGRVQMHEGSWGAGGDNSVWLNAETSPLLAAAYDAELAVRKASSQPAWTEDGVGRRVATQMCRELLLMESSDWSTLITTGAARDYAERRFREHAEAFDAMHACWQELCANGVLSPESLAVLEEFEGRDGIFPDLDPADWQRM